MSLVLVTMSLIFYIFNVLLYNIQMSHFLGRFLNRDLPILLCLTILFNLDL